MGEETLQDVVGTDVATGTHRFMEAVKWMGTDGQGRVGKARECVLESATAFAQAGEPAAVLLCMTLVIGMTNRDHDAGMPFVELLARARAKRRQEMESQWRRGFDAGLKEEWR